MIKPSLLSMTYPMAPLMTLPVAPPPLLLASSSIYRQELLQKLKLPFTCATPNVDETPLPNESASALVLRLAQVKATSLAAQYPNHLIIGSDQVATLDDRIIGKPHTHTKAIEQLMSFQNQTVTFLTGLCLYNTRSQHTQTWVEPYQVSFRTLTHTQVDYYLHIEKPYDCAGSFKSEGLGISLFSKMEGDDPNSLIGLPLIALIRMLNKEGIDPLMD